MSNVNIEELLNLGGDFPAQQRIRILAAQVNASSGLIFSSMEPGCKQDGLPQGKIISVAALLDEQAYPWQADWYRRKVASEHDGDETGIMRLWYFDNVLHDDQTNSIDEHRVTSYLAGLKQALIDVAAWVEKGIAARLLPV